MTRFEHAQQWVTLLKDVAMGTGACVAIYLGFRGLHTWRRQISGTADLELARRLLKSVGMLRETMKAVRGGVIYGYEASAGLKLLGLDEKAEHPIDVQQRAAFQLRWNRLVESRNDVHAMILEAEALWGQEWENALQCIDKLHMDLYVRIIDLTENSKPGGAKSSPAQLQESHAIVYGLPGDPFSEKYEEGIIALQMRVRKHLPARERPIGDLMRSRFKRFFRGA